MSKYLDELRDKKAEVFREYSDRMHEEVGYGKIDEMYSGHGLSAYKKGWNALAEIIERDFKKTIEFYADRDKWFNSKSNKGRFTSFDHAGRSGADMASELYNKYWPEGE